MPFRHVAMFRWASHVDANHASAVREAFDELAARVPGVRSLTHGGDVGVSEGGFDYIVVADFESVADWWAFRDHPSSVLVTEELLRDQVAERVSGQFTVGAERLEPDLGAGAPATSTWSGAPAGPARVAGGGPADESDDDLLERARRAAQAGMDALMAEPDDDIGP